MSELSHFNMVKAHTNNIQHFNNFTNLKDLQPISQLINHNSFKTQFDQFN